jgi:RNA polymerase sigma-70 factor (ECF subfamily)
VNNQYVHVRLPPETPATSVPERHADTLEGLMERYQQADQTAIRVLIERLSPMLMRFFRYQGARPDQAEDLLQDAWLRIHRVRHTYRPRESLLPWVFAIARRTRIDHFRRNRAAAIHEVSSSVVPDAVAPVFDPGLGTTLSVLTDALPASQREVVVMLKAGGMSVEEVARATGSTVGAVKQKAHRAYRRLRQLLSPLPECRTRRGGAD